jgi:hypothetical protein
MSDRVFVMDAGRLVRAGAPAEVFADAGYLRGIGLGLPPATEMAELLGLGPGAAGHTDTADRANNTKRTVPFVSSDAAGHTDAAAPEENTKGTVPFVSSGPGGAGAILDMDGLVEAIVRGRGVGAP